MSDHWNVLGLVPGSSTADVRAAYRRLARRTHPDHGGDPVEFRRVHAAAVACLLETTTTAEGEPADGDGWPLVLDGLPARGPSFWDRHVEPVLNFAFALAGCVMFLGVAYVGLVVAATLLMMGVHSALTSVLRELTPS